MNSREHDALINAVLAPFGGSYFRLATATGLNTAERRRSDREFEAWWTKLYGQKPKKKKGKEKEG